MKEIYITKTFERVLVISATDIPKGVELKAYLEQQSIDMDENVTLDLISTDIEDDEGNTYELR